MIEKQNFKQLSEFVSDMNVSNQTTRKLEVLKMWSSNDFIRKVLYYTYNPYYQYHLTPDTLEKYYVEDLGTLYEFTDLFEMLDALRKREVTGHKAINSVNHFCWRHEDYKDLVYKIIGKDLEIRLGDTLINKVIPNCIPTFDVALATDFEKVNPDVTDGSWYASHKIDGCRCLAVINDSGICTLWSRQGKEFYTLDKVKMEIESLGLKDCVLDGEICLIDDNGNEDFSSIMSVIRRKDYTIENPKFLIFDALTLDEFNSKTSTRRLSDRLLTLNMILRDRDLSTLAELQQIKIESNEHLQSLLDMADSKNWEGLIVRRDVAYEGKRGKNMLKCKTFKDAEYVVLDMEVGPFRVIEDGCEKTIDVMSNIIIEHKGNRVSVGSGWSLSQRMHYYNNPNDIIGKVVTIKYFQESVNKLGEFSLRFPTLKIVHGISRTT